MAHVHSFAESLQFSHAADELPIWKEMYEQAFPGMTAMINHRQDGEHQRAGVDRSVILANSKQLLIDEKIRGRNKKTGKVYEDIALDGYTTLSVGVPLKTLFLAIGDGLRADFEAIEIEQ